MRRAVPDTPDDLDLRALRAVFVPEPAPARSAEPEASRPRLIADAPPVVAPDADEVLAASPTVVRLCESYAEARDRAVRRGRTQRLGLAALVSAVLVTAAALSRMGEIRAEVVQLLALAVAGLSVVALGILASLFVRDERRLRVRQGDRMRRALSLGCNLPRTAIEAFLARRDAAGAFFDCFAVWCASSSPRKRRFSFGRSASA